MKTEKQEVAACERAYRKAGYLNAKNYYMFKAGWFAKANTK